MSLPPLVIAGASGHAKVIIDLIRAEGRYQVVGLVDLDPTPRKVAGVDVIGAEELLPSLRSQGIAHAFVGVGANKARLAIGRRLEGLGFTLANAVSPAAVLSPSTHLGHGVAIMAGAVVNADSRIDDLAILNTRASLDHDGHIGEGAHVAPGCALAGNVTVERLAFLGVGTAVIPGITIGEAAMVGAGACVVRNVPARAQVRGVPARIVER